MRRRHFIAALAAVVTTPTMGPPAVFAEAEKVRRIGVLMGLSESNADIREFVATFVEELARLGWVEGRNAAIARYWTNADLQRAGTLANELVASSPDVIFTATTPATAAVKRATGTIPIVFTIVSDPVGAGFVAGLPRPGGNIMGFTHSDAGLAGKWLDLLKEIAPGRHQTRGDYVQSRHSARRLKCFPRLVRGGCQSASSRAGCLAGTQ
jgi:putative tryptophan/tyrosine transport system substrate-binding protein